MEERGFSSPACLAHEADPRYMGLLAPDDLPAARAELAACAAAFARLARDAHEAGSARAGALSRAARLAGAAARAGAGPQAGVAAPATAGAAELAFEARRSAARLRALAARLPDRGEEELRLARALRAAIRAHELLIAAIEQGG